MMKNIQLGDELYIQILKAEWYGKLISLDDNGIEFEVSKGRGEGNIVYSTEQYTITKIKEKEEKKDEEQR